MKTIQLNFLAVGGREVAGTGTAPRPLSTSMIRG